MKAKMEMRRILVSYHNREPRDRNERAAAWFKMRKEQRAVFLSLSYDDQIIGCATDRNLYLNYFEILTPEQQSAVRLML